MSKLVKLTTTLNQNRDTNGYIAICDNDIILEPNAKVSLLNAHLSSGIVTDYRIVGTDTIAQSSGQNIGFVNLGDRNRNIVINNGNYAIESLLSELQREINVGLVFNSTPASLDANATTLNIPTNQDFGLGTQVSLQTDNKVKIAYNSTPQKYGPDLAFSVKTNGINVDASTGDITWNGTAGLVEFDLQQNLAQQSPRSVVTTGPVAGQLALLDTVTLLNSVTGANRVTKIMAIAVETDNISTAFAIDPTKTDNATGEVVSLAIQASVLGLKPNDPVTLDDGAGVVGTPSVNTVTAQVDTATLIPINDVYTINNLPFAKLQGPAGFVSFSPIQPGSIAQLSPTQFQMSLETLYVDLPIKHIVVDALFNILDGNGADYLYAQIVSVIENKANPLNPVPQVIVNVIKNYTVINPIDITQMVTFQTAEFLSGIYGQTDTLFEAGMDIGFFDTNINVYGEATLAADPVDITDGTGTYLSYEITPGAYQSAFGTLAPGLESYADIKNRFFQGRTIADMLITPLSHFITADVTNTITIINGDSVVIDKVELFPATVNDNPKTIVVNTNDYVLIPLDFAGFDIVENVIKGMARGGLEIVKDNFNALLHVILKNTSGTLNTTGALTRLWQGTNIQLTNRLTVFDGNGKMVTNIYDTITKGDKFFTQNTAYCIEDNILSRSCGRACFTVVDVAPCEFGIYPDSRNMLEGLNLSPLSVQIAYLTIGGVRNLYYVINQNGVEKSFKRKVVAKTGDKVIIQWGVTPGPGDFEFNDSVTNATVAADIDRLGISAVSGSSSGDNYDADRGKVLITIVRLNGFKNWINIGAPISDPTLSNPLQQQAAQCIYWTPRANPYVSPIYWDNNGNYHLYVSPQASTIRVQELSPNQTFAVNALTGAVSHITGDNHIYHPDMHSSNNLELLNMPATKFSSLTNPFTFTFTDSTFQRQLGYKLITKTITGLTGSWVAELDYLRAYLPEGIVILLENLSIDTFDCGQFNGSRRNIIASAMDTQDKLGEISVEPNNLYRISIGNKQAINLRKFAIAFEDLNGQRLVLNNARVTVCLLFE